MVVSLLAGGIALGQNFNLLTITEESTLKAPTEPIVSILAFFLILMVIIFINKTK